VKPILSIMAVLVAGSGLWWITAGRDATAAEDEGGPIKTVAVSRRDIATTVLATGVVRPQVGAEVRVGSRVSGALERLYVTAGDRVRQGQLLARLDSAEFHTRVMQGLANLENARAESTYAAGEWTRARDLFDRGIITESDFAQAQRLRDVRASEVRQAAAALESARIQLGYTRIRAPIGGVVASVSTQVGETIAASLAAPTFVTIVDLDRLEVWAYVDETDIGRVAVGQPARFTVDTYADAEFEGVVSAIRPTAEIQDNVVNYVTVISIRPGHGRTLRPEMTATVTILLDQREQVLVVPNEAVRRDRDGSYVFVARDGDYARQPVRTGQRGREFTEILDGLDDGDRVVTGSPPR